MAEDAPRERWDGWVGPRTWIPVAGLLVVALAALGGLLAFNWDGSGSTSSGASAASNSSPFKDGRQSTHQHADFLVIIRGKQIDYGQKQFIAELGNEASDAAHVHLPHTTVVHVHKTSTTWDEFFRSVQTELLDASYPTVKLGAACMKLPGGDKVCDGNGESFKFIVNGVKVDGIANTEIHDMDRVLVSFGPETFQQVMDQQWPKVSDQACILSERCSERIPKDEPPETCQGQGDCVKPGG